MAAPPRSTGRRRWLGVVALVVLAVALGVATSILTGVGGGERVSRLWVAATLSGDGSAAVVEVVDYDFGANQRHGIFRDVPGLRRSAPVQVSSPDAPDAVTVENDGSTTRLRIGDPTRTVSGAHRYVLRYTLDGVVRNGQVAWDAVGTGWDAPVDEADVHVVAPTALDGARCAAGSAGSTDGCAVRETRPGSLTARATDLGSGQGLTLYAATGAPLASTPALPTPPDTAPAQARVNPAYPGLLAGGLAVLVGLLCSWLLRRAGREHAPDVGLPVAAAPGEAARIDLAELGRSAVPSPSLPAGLCPSQGGVLLAEGVGNQHRAAWLIEQAVAGAIDLEGGEKWRAKDLALVRRGPGAPGAEPLLDLAFRGRDRVQLGRYDRAFAEAWKAIGADLDAWRHDCGLWDAAADRRATRVRVLGALVGVAGAAVALAGAWFSARSGALPLVWAAIGGTLAGAGAAAAIRGWELRVLTPKGSSAWLQVESLRRFLAQSPPTAIDEAVAAHQLGVYTAWAVALGEAERWSQLASSASVPAGPRYDPYLRYATYGPVFVSSCSTASVSPSSSSGGGGGGGVGGGAGGGGGGSW